MSEAPKNIVKVKQNDAYKQVKTTFNYKNADLTSWQCAVLSSNTTSLSSNLASLNKLTYTLPQSSVLEHKFNNNKNSHNNSIKLDKIKINLFTKIEQNIKNNSNKKNRKTNESSDLSVQESNKWSKFKT
jgi:hypothetical protein